ncbi:hypothetical protein JQK87_18045 [Streptomyces sp. G44]|uniref:hypothetical protein n=1 Tax=Streptomyces sp. G44 TaxID=2807632 RepID=UPI00195F517E|nr:hypothetical protein [Streptomyces sp. G44]MBM7170269.1 hypothetical protein [Streptomyces sp. G44]
MTGLYCPVATDTCRAASMRLRSPRIRFGGADGDAVSCLSARRLTLTGPLRFRVSSVRGRAFGVLPLTVSTRTVPPVPVPYLEFEGAVAHGLWVEAAGVRGRAAAIGGRGVC